MTDSIPDLLYRIRRCVWAGVTTTGPCPECGTASPGSGLCAPCAGNALDDLLGHGVGTDVVRCSVALRDAQQRVYDAGGISNE